MKEQKQNWFKAHPYWTGIIALIIVGMVISAVSPQDDRVEELENQVKGLEEGILKTCEWGKQGSVLGVAVAEMYENLGIEFDVDVNALQEGANVNCYTIRDRWKNEYS